MILSRESFKTRLASMFNQFTGEVNFEQQVSVPLGLFKLQMAFVGISYNA